MLEVIEAEEKKTKNDFNCKTVKSILFMKIYRVIQGHKEELRKLKTSFQKINQLLRNILPELPILETPCIQQLTILCIMNIFIVI